MLGLPLRSWPATAGGVSTLVLAAALTGCAGSTTEHWRMTESVAPTSAGGSDQPVAAVQAVFFREAGTSPKATQPMSLSLILCARHTLTHRSMYAKQEEAAGRFAGHPR